MNSVRFKFWLARNIELNVFAYSYNYHYPSITLDYWNRPHIAFESRGGLNDGAYYVKWDGYQWVDFDGSGQESLDISRTGQYPTGDSLNITLDGAGNPDIALGHRRRRPPGRYRRRAPAAQA